MILKMHHWRFSQTSSPPNEVHQFSWEIARSMWRTVNSRLSSCSIILPSHRAAVSIRAAQLLRYFCPYQLSPAFSVPSTMKAFTSALAAILAGLSAATPIANSAAVAETHLEKRTNAGVYICNNINFVAPCVHLVNPTGDCSTFSDSSDTLVISTGRKSFS